jgi:hypothetical protein
MVNVMHEVALYEGFSQEGNGSGASQHLQTGLESDGRFHVEIFQRGESEGSYGQDKCGSSQCRVRLCVCECECQRSRDDGDIRYQYSPHPSWEEVRARFNELRDIL